MFTFLRLHLSFGTPTAIQRGLSPAPRWRAPVDATLELTHERVDDVPLLLGFLIKLKLPEILDRHYPAHPLHPPPTRVPSTRTPSPPTTPTHPPPPRPTRPPSMSDAARTHTHTPPPPAPPHHHLKIGPHPPYPEPKAPTPEAPPP